MSYCSREYVDERLNEWAKWYTYRGDFGLGFPSQSIEKRLMESGGILIRSSNTKSITSNESAEEIERLVRELYLYNQKTANALKEYYFGQGNYKCRAKQVGLSYSQYKVYVDLAKFWLAGRLISLNRE